MRRIAITRYNNPSPKVLDNNDKYDSTLELLDGADLQYKSIFVNVDPSVRYLGKSGRLAPGRYFGIVGYRFNEESQKWDGKRVVKLFNTHTNLKYITDHTCLSDENMTVESEIPNPNQAGMKVLRYVQIHDGGSNWDWSQGCVTIYNNEGDYDKFMNLVKDNEILEIIMV